MRLELKPRRIQLIPNQEQKHEKNMGREIEHRQSPLR